MNYLIIFITIINNGNDLYLFCAFYMLGLICIFCLIVKSILMNILKSKLNL